MTVIMMAVAGLLFVLKMTGCMTNPGVTLAALNVAESMMVPEETSDVLMGAGSSTLQAKTLAGSKATGYMTDKAGSSPGQRG